MARSTAFESISMRPGTAVIVTIAHSYWGGTNLPPPFQSLTTSASSCFATGA